jgi:hypothetical protein
MTGRSYSMKWAIQAITGGSLPIKIRAGKGLRPKGRKKYI